LHRAFEPQEALEPLLAVELEAAVEGLAVVDADLAQADV